MQTKNNHALFIFFSILTLIIIYLLAPILTPFMLGALFAYLASPLVRFLERKGMPHLLAVVSIFALIFGAFISIILLLVPLVEVQIATLVEMLPDIINWIEEQVRPWIQEFVSMNTLKAGIPAGLAKSTEALGAVLASGYTLVHWAVNIVLTPVVTFYLLRDWDNVYENFLKLFPKSKEPTINKIAEECDDVLGGFFRGQLLVMVALSLIYGIGLTLIGLKIGLIIGLIGGLLSIVPFLGSTFVVVTASLAAIVQYTTWESLLMVFIVFLIGQAIEGYVLTPYLIGKRIGLNPVVIIFAIMAGGTLFGFFGVLLALPVAAVGKVLLRFINRRYLHTRLC